jgi:class 3 adenylate cyclase
VLLELAERLADVGHANTPTRDSDGVLRRLPLLLDTDHGPLVYMGAELAAKSFEDAAHRAEVVVSGGSVSVRQLDRASGAVTREVELPLSKSGTTVCAWAEWPSTQKLTLLKLIEYDRALYRTRLENLDLAIGEALKAQPEGLPEPYTGWAALRAAWQSVETPRNGEEIVAPERIAELDRRLDATAALVLGDCRVAAEALLKEAAETREKAKSAPARMRPSFEKKADELEKAAAERRGWAERLEAPERIAAELRPVARGKLAIIGGSATSLGDIWSTPLGEVPGVDVHGNAASMVLSGSRFRYAPGLVNFLYITLVGFLAVVGVTFWSTGRSALLAAALMAASFAVFMQAGARASLLLSGAGPLMSVALAYTTGLAWRELVTRRSQRQMRKELERRYSPELVELIVRDPELLKRPRKLVASIFFSDIKGFTSISEGMEPERLIAFMNRYHDRMTHILKEERAYVDKYIGDGIMALFGAPIEYPDHALSCCRAALRSVEATRQLSEQFVAEGLPAISIRVGLNSGPIIAAYVGAADRADYTAIADAVNLAARLEGANKFYSSAIMAGEGTVALAKERFWFRELDLIRVVGKRQGVRVYELVGERDGGQSRFGKDFHDTYDAAMSAFRERNWSLAASLFARCLELKPGDVPSTIHESRAQGFAMNPPPAEWDGVFELASK